ncbi:hypothetical protein SCRM01_095c [Synechococcus phage S-CRM01]|uniref:hypothetical protein n=1 Tax=Synechococcus phage S-CRM01 TaxID=1026955 RepID=UPI000209E39B|nr:hypothetical protein SCRM01_095c [Synechococcus phage S-CRM01]AEC53041.1 hypothetical protein SCRM01_095c [Synechococcus phage S-CRM01]
MSNFLYSLQESYLEVYEGYKPQPDYDEYRQRKDEVRDEHLRKAKAGELPYQKRKKADNAQKFLKDHPKKKIRQLKKKLSPI